VWLRATTVRCPCVDERTCECVADISCDTLCNVTCQQFSTTCEYRPSACSPACNCLSLPVCLSVCLSLSLCMFVCFLVRLARVTSRTACPRHCARSQTTHETHAVTFSFKISIERYDNLLIFVAAWYAETCRLLFILSATLLVGHAFNEISEVRQQISHRQVIRTGQNLAHW